MPNLLIVLRLDFYGALRGEFDRIFHQVDQNLLETPLVTDKKRKTSRLMHSPNAIMIITAFSDRRCRCSE